MNSKLEELQKRIAGLENEAKELQRLKSDCQEVREILKMLVKERND